jgi:hypothetical protein
MQWRKERIESIPEVYLDFMRVLKPVIDTRDEVLKITGIPLAQVFNAFRTKYQYEPREIRELALNLEERGLISRDRFGSLVPTALGEALIQALAENEQPAPSRVSPLPAF